MFWKRLLDQGLYVNLALPPATPDGSAILRSSVSAAHTTQQIDRAIGMFAMVAEDLGVIRPRPMAAAG